MRRALFPLILMAALCAGAEPRQFTKADAHGSEIDPERFTFKTCTLRDDGRATCGRWRFRLPVDDGEIESVYFAELPSALLLAYELTDWESTWAKLVRVEVGKKRPEWTFAIPALNLAPPAVQEDDIYVAALGYLARVNALNGWHAWMIDRAYDGAGFEHVTFTIEPPYVVVTRHHSSKPLTMVECFNLETGACVGCPR